MRRLELMIGAVAGLVALVGGCQLIAGVKDAVPYPADGGTGSGGQGGGATMCSPGTKISCYSGPMGTKGAGLCHAGEQTCRMDGSGYDACSGEVTPKAESCAAAADENCDGHDCVQWAELFGDGADQQATALAVDASGNIYVVGTFTGAFKAGNKTISDSGAGDAFVLKVDPNGEPLWGQAFGDSSLQLASAVALDSIGNVVVGGWSDSSISLGGLAVPAGLFVAKFTSEGEHLWSKGLESMGCGSPSGRIASIVTTATNDFILGGSFCGTIDLGDGPVASAGQEDAFVAEIRGGDGSGTKLKGGWLRTYGDDKSQIVNVVTLDSTHSQIVAVGDFEGAIKAGSVTLTATDAYPDMFYVRLFPDGKDLWAEAYGATGTQAATGAVMTKAGDLIITGNFSDPFDVQGHPISAPAFSSSTFMIDFDSSDTYKWSKVLQADMNSAIFATSLRLDAAEDLVLTGFFNGSIDFGDGSFQQPGTKMNIFLAKVTVTGDPIWKKYFINNNSGLTLPFGALAPAGEPILAGLMTEPIDFGTGLLTSSGAQDIFLAKFSP
jgi:hypothetical protein